MLNSAIAKTKSALKKPRKRLLFVAVGITLVLLCTVLLTIQNRHYVHVGTHTYVAEIASTPAAQEQGLSSRMGMSTRQAMLFTYNKPQKLCFWMKDMYFPLDMIWLNADHQVVYIKQNVSPQTYPRAFCAQAQYVLELQAGQAHASGMYVGQRIDF
jgi:uncharacterized membrane protein (UPF0127 family)